MRLTITIGNDTRLNILSCWSILKVKDWDKKSDSEKWEARVFAKSSTRRTFVNKGLMMKRRSVVAFNRVSFRLNRRFASRATSASLNAKLISSTSISFCQSEPSHLREQYANIKAKLGCRRNLWENFFRYFVDRAVRNNLSFKLQYIYSLYGKIKLFRCGLNFKRSLK